MTTNLVRSVLAVAVVLATIWFNSVQLADAFGEGPPYYGRTTNMDKWENPVPTLTGVDLAATIVTLGLLAPIIRKRMRGRANAKAQTGRGTRSS